MAIKKKEQQTEEADLTQLQNDRVVPIVKKLFAVIAEKIDDFPFGADFHKEEAKRLEVSADIAMAVLALAIENKLTRDDLRFLFQLVIQPLQEIEMRAIETINGYYDGAVLKYFDKNVTEDYVGNITIREVVEKVLGPVVAKDGVVEVKVEEE